MEAQRLKYWIMLLGIEGEVAEAYQGLEPGDDVIFIEDLYGVDDG